VAAKIINEEMANIGVAGGGVIMAWLMAGGVAGWR
jgi:hypothetical protein